MLLLCLRYEEGRARIGQLETRSFEILRLFQSSSRGSFENAEVRAPYIAQEFKGMPEQFLTFLQVFFFSCGSVEAEVAHLEPKIL